MSSRYDEVYRRSLQDPMGFWAEAAEAIHWDKRWDRVLDDSNAPFSRWYPSQTRATRNPRVCRSEY